MTTKLAALAQLRQALALKQQIEALKSELAAILETAAAMPISARAPKSAPAPPRHTAPLQQPRHSVQIAKRRKTPQPRPALARQSSLLGLYLAADLPRPIRTGRRKSGAKANRVAAATKIP